MRHFQRKGNRIRASDRTLVFRTATGFLLLVFLVVVLLLNIGTLFHTDWKSASLLHEGSLHLTVTPYMIGSVMVAGAVSVAAAFLYRYFLPDKVKQLSHRQKLARMILEHGLIHIQAEITLGKYQEQLLHLEKKLETGLYCELVSKELKDSFVEYVLLYDTIANRITIDEVQAAHGSLKLMANVSWEYDKLPHMLIAGGTGGGKTYFILTIIEALLRTNAQMYVLDPKNADLADLSAVMPEVYYRKEDITACIERFYDGMMERSEAMKLMDGYKTGENYAYLNLPPHFLIFDEYVAFMEMLTTKENAAVLNKLKQIVMLGRQAGYFLILACQRPDAKYLGDGIRDQFNFRVALGRMSELGYSMMFGEVDKDFFLKQIKGRGYVDVGTNVISEFYTPLVPKGHDFLKEIGRLMQQRQDGQAACEAKAAGTD